MRFLLTLLALLSGLSVSDRAVAAPASPATLGAMVQLAESVSQAEVQAERSRAPVSLKQRLKFSGSDRLGRSANPTHRPGFLLRVDRSIE